MDPLNPEKVFGEVKRLVEIEDIGGGIRWERLRLESRNISQVLATRSD